MTSMSDPMNDGLRAERVRKRRLWTVFLAVCAIGLAVDLVLISMARHAPASGPLLPPLAASVGALILVLLLNVGCWFALRLGDEVEYQDNLLSFSIGFLFNISAWVAWPLLSWGGLAPRPDFDLLTVASVAVAGLAYASLKLRRILL
jgi:hypothetical protein